MKTLAYIAWFAGAAALALAQNTTEPANSDSLFQLRFTTVKPDKVAEFERLQKEELIPALKKAGGAIRIASSYATFGDGYTYAFGSPLASFADLDEDDSAIPRVFCRI
jgi:hypothetical protein